jgi:sensor histidine kinase YesM
LPPLILQPIIENAVRHGVRGRNDKAGLIEIEAEKHNGCVLISIKDNGPGIKHSQRSATAASLSHHSMGMRLVEERIKVFNDFGEKKIVMQSDEGPDFRALSRNFRQN